MEFLEYLNTIIKDRTLTYDDTLVVCGAGISVDSYLPSGAQLVNQIYDDFNLRDDIGCFFKEFKEKIIPRIYGYNATYFFHSQD